MKRLHSLVKSPEFLRIAAIFLFALAVRMVYLYEIHDNPFFGHLLIDETSYHRWASRIAAGEWLGREIFYQDPLYPYFLGVIYAIIGKSFLWVRVIQLVIGSGTCVLIYLLGKSFFDVRTGVVAGVIAALYKPFFYFEGLFLKTFLGVFLLCAFLLLVVAARRRRGLLPWLGAGLVLGLLVLVRSNCLALAGGVLLWLFVVDWETEKLKGKLVAAAGFMLGLAIVLSTVCARNYIVGKEVVLLTSQAGQNFFIGNNRWNGNGRYQPPIYIRPHPKYEQKDFRTRAEKLTGRRLNATETSAFWFKRSIEHIEADPSRWLKLIWTKFRLFWNWYEVPDNQNFYFFSRYSILLSAWLPDFRMVAALGLCGMALCLRQWRKLLLPYLVVILYSGTVILFYIFGRYKLPVVPPLILFGAYVLASLPEMIGGKKFIKLGAAAALTIGSVAFLSMDVTPDDYSADRANAYCRLGSVLARDEKFDEALFAYGRALNISPHYWAAYYGLGNAYEHMGELEAALKGYEEAAKLNLGSPDPHVRMGHLHFQIGQYEESAERYEQALTFDPNKPGLHRRLVSIYQLLGNEEKALAHFRKLQELETLKE